MKFRQLLYLSDPSHPTENLSEAFHSTINIRSVHRQQKNIDVFKNPTSKEVREVFKVYLNSAKGLVAPNGDLYIFDADVIHSEVKDELKLSDTISITVDGGKKTVKVYFTDVKMHIPTEEIENTINRIKGILPNMLRKYRIVT